MAQSFIIEQELALSFWLDLTVTLDISDILLDDGSEGNLRKEGRSVRIVVSITSSSRRTKVWPRAQGLVLMQTRANGLLHYITLGHPPIARSLCLSVDAFNFSPGQWLNPLLV